MKLLCRNCGREWIPKIIRGRIVWQCPFCGSDDLEER